MAASVTIYNKKTGEKKRAYTVDVKEMLVHPGGDWALWDPSVEKAKPEVAASPDPAPLGSEAGSAGFPDNPDPIED